MRRSIAKMLILFVLFANFSWAADMDEIGVGHGSDTVVSLAGGLDQPSGDSGTGHDGLKNGPCDHCCHGSAHYIGFPPQSFSTFTDCGSASLAFWLTAYHGRDKEPPLQPPKI